MSKFHPVAWAAVWAVLLTVTASAGPPERPDRWVRHLMGTRVQILVPNPTEGTAKLVVETFAEMSRLADILSEWNPDSELSTLNQHAGETKAVPVGTDTLAVLQAGIRLGRESGGAFDISWAALNGIWDFRKEPFEVPSDAALNKAASLVDYRLVEVNPEQQTARLPKAGMKVGLGAIAKGYIVDRGLQWLTERGIKNVIVSAGGDMAVRGTRAGRPFRVGIQHPRCPGVLIGGLEARDEAVVTSGDYERFVMHEGTRYHHILDPRTARPARKAISVTVVAQKAMEADALSTAAFVLGPDKGLALLERLKGVEGVVVTPDGRIVRTSGLKKRFWLASERLGPCPAKQ